MKNVNYVNVSYVIYFGQGCPGYNISGKGVHWFSEIPHLNLENHLAKNLSRNCRVNKLLLDKKIGSLPPTLSCLIFEWIIFTLNSKHISVENNVFHYQRKNEKNFNLLINKLSFYFTENNSIRNIYIILPEQLVGV